MYDKIYLLSNITGHMKIPKIVNFLIKVIKIIKFHSKSIFSLAFLIHPASLPRN